MIRPLRRLHRWVMFVLAILLPVVIALSLLLREDQPLQLDWTFLSQ